MMQFGTMFQISADKKLYTPDGGHTFLSPSGYDPDCGTDFAETSHKMESQTMAFNSDLVYRCGKSRVFV